MLAALTEAWTQQQRQQPLPLPPLPAQAEADNTDIINLTQKFMKMKLPTFCGGIEPLKAETWLLEIEKLYEVFPCTETQKVLIATYTLKDEARRDRKVSEFQELKQGRMSVAEHEAKFTELARFAPHMVDTDYKKVRKFEGGLDLEVFDRVGVLKLPTYVEVLDRSLMAKATIAAMRQSKAPVTITTEWRGKRSKFGSKKSRSFVSKKQNTGSTNSSSQRDRSNPICLDCGKRHRGVCHRVSDACYRCSQPGHVVRDCPFRYDNASRPAASSARSASVAKTNAKANTGKEPQRQGRVFALVPSDVPNTYIVVSGKVNTVADALSRKSTGSLSCLLSNRKELLNDLEQVGLSTAIFAQPAILDEIKQKQCEDEYLKKIIEEFDSKPRPGFGFKVCVEILVEFTTRFAD
ncbi:uncharacterized protein LOC114298162 [Camellia sinensis]|uniref:uncharacterized protein LOC114298162 n=1 Tax=Camellia sinensis TaxID=4442 RepID=UPI0010357490|nr:uncharacterized protein LOC114298162 [Camellia sinensis]